MRIASILENQKIEKRISITPETAKKYLSLGMEVSLPKNYGSHLGINDNEYKNKSVILIDDVLHSGKTLMYASKAFLNTPLKKMSILVLVNRDHNSYPIKAKYVGLSLSTTLKEYIRVELSNRNSGVYLS